MRFNLAARSLHLLMVITVLFQLFSSLWMQVPEPGKLNHWEQHLFYWHALFFGWLALMVGFIYFFVVRTDPETWAQFFPWLVKERRAAFFNALKTEIPDLFRGKLAPAEPKSPLAGAVHGLGMLLLIGLGLTGLYVMQGVRSDGTMSSDVLIFLDLHAALGVMIWAFLGAHIFMTVYHLLLGHRELFDIFKFGRTK